MIGELVWVVVVLAEQVFASEVLSAFQQVLMQIVLLDHLSGLKRN